MSILSPAGKTRYPRAAVFALLLGSVLCQPRAHALDWPGWRFSEWERERKVAATNLAGALFITTWGVSNWEYFQHSPRARSEGWFDADTKEGGADKLGHLYTNYALGHGLAALYEHWGYSRREAALRGAWSSFGLLGLMELGDSFSEYGFSHEDMVMNALGSYLGYLTWTRPDLGQRLDLRIELQPELDRTDIFTDYENLKYLVALKLDSFATLRDTPLQYLELHLGYYARGYSQPDPASRERNAYVGVGINLSRILRNLGHPRSARVFNYLQVPGVYAESSRDLND